MRRDARFCSSFCRSFVSRAAKSSVGAQAPTERSRQPSPCSNPRLPSFVAVEIEEPSVQRPGTAGLEL